MAEKIIVSPQFSLQARDFIKGLLVAVLTAVIVVVQQTLETGSLTFNWKNIATVAIGAVLAYLAKNFFTAPTVTTVYKSNEQAVTVAQDIKDAKV